MIVNDKKTEKLFMATLIPYNSDEGNILTIKAKTESEVQEIIDSYKHDFPDEQYQVEDFIEILAYRKINIDN